METNKKLIQRINETDSFLKSKITGIYQANQKKEKMQTFETTNFLFFVPKIFC